MPRKKVITRHTGTRREQLKYKVCVSGAAETGHCAKDAHEKVEELGREIARHDLILVTGATTGMPYWAAKGAKEEGGIVIGFSPAASKVAHVKSYHLPLDYHDIIVYTGFDYSGRNLILIRSSDSVISVCGRMGTLNEFTIAFEDKKPTGVLEGTGGTSDLIRGLVEQAHRGPGKMAYSQDPKDLVEQLIELMIEDDKSAGLDKKILV
jgi:uncharacterized protein (TIGR00725 family)